MSFDSSRFPSDPWKNYFGVVMQQGRVQLDSDWNEWLAEFARRVQADTLDIVGQAGVPAITPHGFEIALGVVAGSTSISIGPGRMYVDGLLAENHGVPAPNPAKWIPASDAVAEPAYPDWDRSLDELRGDGSVDYNAQPYYPNATPFPQSGGPYLVYLDVWQRDITFLDDPDLVEKAVGVDTTGRLQIVWQVKWLDVSSVSGVTCTTDLPDWDTLLLPPGPRLSTGVVQSSPTGPCCLTSNTGYTGLENQLYRVEIHEPGVSVPDTVSPPVTATSGTATFKWSRDNASVTTGVSAITQGGLLLTVQSTGKDAVLCFSPNDWVEITDDWLELNGLPGELRQVSFVSNTAKTITLTAAVSSFPVDSNGQTYPSRHTRLTRWNQGGTVYKSDGTTVWTDLSAPGSTGDIPVPPPGTALILENGITVSFDRVSSGTPFNTGDYWTLAARTADGTVEYLDKAPPRGIYHHYARLALVTMPNTVTNCRVVFPPLTGIQPGGCCCCSVTVGDGISSQGDFGDIQQAIDSLAGVTTPVEVCVLPGAYRLEAAVTITRNNLTLRGCSQARIQFTGSGPAIQVAPASSGASVGQITLDSLNVQAPSLVVEISLGVQIAIRDCTFTITDDGAGGFAIVAQSSGLEVRGNQLMGGGIWALDGSSHVSIQDNVITKSAGPRVGVVDGRGGLAGPGVGLGGLPPSINAAPDATGVVAVEIVANQITGAANSGISTVVDAVQSDNQAAMGDIEDLLIEGNVISDCARAAPTQPYSQRAVAGILLHNATNVCIRENEIAGNGITNGIPTCGVVAENVSNLEIAHNRIIDNGVGPRADANGVQAGILGKNVSRYVATDTLHIHDNEVRMPSGPALSIVGTGPMSIIGNSLQSFGVWPREQTYGLAVSITNFGLPLELGSVSLGALERATSQITITPFAATPDVTLMDGRTLFASNQVTFASGVQAGQSIPCVFLSFDDLAIQHNQFEAIAPGILAHTYALAAFSLRCIGNRLSEVPGTAILAHLGVGLWNIVNENQATHCVVALGANTMTGTTNQIMGGAIITRRCSELTRSLQTTFGGQ